MELLNRLDWKSYWHLIKDIILPHSGTLIYNIFLFITLGILTSIVYVIVLYKKGVFTRKPKYYNWVVKLYIPLLIATFLYCFGQIGFLKGVYKIVNSEKELFVGSLYAGTIGYAFETEKDKVKFVKETQAYAKNAKDGTNLLIEPYKQRLLKLDSGNSFVNNSKNKLSLFLIQNYGDDICASSVYGILKMSGKNEGETMDLETFTAATEYLLAADHKVIESAIIDKLNFWFTSFIDSHYNSMLKSIIIVLAIIISLPIIEFLVYKKWIEPKLNKSELKAKSNE